MIKTIASVIVWTLGMLIAGILVRIGYIGYQLPDMIATWIGG